MRGRVKRLCALLLAAALLAGLSACGGKSAKAPEEGGKLKIVATIFPEYDWVREILGERQAEVELTLLMDSGATGAHNFKYVSMFCLGAAVISFLLPLLNWKRKRQEIQ